MKVAEILAMVEQLGVNHGASSRGRAHARAARAETIRMLRGPVSELYSPHELRAPRADCLSACAMGLQQAGKPREAEWLLQLARLTDLLDQKPYKEHIDALKEDAK